MREPSPFVQTLVNVDEGATLTLGLTAASYPSALVGGTFKLQGTLVAHGGFDLFSGTLDTGSRDRESTITVDTVKGFRLWGGMLRITDVDAKGWLSVYGKFSAYGGTIEIKVVTSVIVGGGWRTGGITVHGDVELSPMATLKTRDIENTPGIEWIWHQLNWTGTRTGALTLDLPAGWTHVWNDADKRLEIHQDSPEEEAEPPPPPGA